MKKEKVKNLKSDVKLDLLFNSNQTNLSDVLDLINDYEESQIEIVKLKNEVHALNERLENYIPRRRVRRVFKQLKKILEQDGVTDDLDTEE